MRARAGVQSELVVGGRRGRNDVRAGGRGFDDDRATLEDVTVLGGALHVIAAGLEDLDLLECLTEVRGELRIDALTSIPGFAGLAIVFGDVHVTDNPQLTSIDGFTDTVAVLGAVVFDNNPKLCRSQIDAFVAGLDVVGAVSITGNDDGC